MTDERVDETTPPPPEGYAADGSLLPGYALNSEGFAERTPAAAPPPEGYAADGSLLPGYALNSEGFAERTPAAAPPDNVLRMDPIEFVGGAAPPTVATEGHVTLVMGTPTVATEGHVTLVMGTPTEIKPDPISLVMGTPIEVKPDPISLGLGKQPDAGSGAALLGTLGGPGGVAPARTGATGALPGTTAGPGTTSGSGTTLGSGGTSSGSPAAPSSSPTTARSDLSTAGGGSFGAPAVGTSPGVPSSSPAAGSSTTPTAPASASPDPPNWTSVTMTTPGGTPIAFSSTVGGAAPPAAPGGGTPATTPAAPSAEEAAAERAAAEKAAAEQAAAEKAAADDDTEEEDTEEDDEYVNPDAATGAPTGLAGSVALGLGLDAVPISVTAHGGDPVNPGDGLGGDWIDGTLAGPLRAGPDVNPDAADDLTGAGTFRAPIDGGDPLNPADDFGPAPISPPDDTGIDPYASTSSASTAGVMSGVTTNVGPSTGPAPFGSAADDFSVGAADLTAASPAADLAPAAPGPDALTSQDASATTESSDLGDWKAPTAELETADNAAAGTVAWDPGESNLAVPSIPAFNADAGAPNPAAEDSAVGPLPDAPTQN